MSNLQVKLAKASKDDIQRVIAFFHVIEEYMEYGTFTPESEGFEEDSIDLDPYAFVRLLRGHWNGREGVEASWMRVVNGCDVLIDNVCDPDVEVLELRKDWAEVIAKEAAK